MKDNKHPDTTRPLFEMGSELPPLRDVKQDIGNRVAEGKRIVKRLVDIFDDHRTAAVSLNVDLGVEDLRSVLQSLREHAQGASGIPVSGARDEIHGYCLNRLFEELVEEPSNILFTTKTGPETIRYDAMSVTFWVECLDLMEATYCSKES
jgi:hypothetical protein